VRDPLRQYAECSPGHSRPPTYHANKRGSVRTISGMSAVSFTSRTPKVSFSLNRMVSIEEHVDVGDDEQVAEHELVRSRRKMSARRMSVKDYLE